MRALYTIYQDDDGNLRLSDHKAEMVEIYPISQWAQLAHDLKHFLSHHEHEEIIDGVKTVTELRHMKGSNS